MRSRAVSTWIEAVYWASWAAVIALYVAWPLTHLDAYGWSNDEGLYVQRAALATVGHPLYSEVLFSKPPKLIWIRQLAFRVADQTLTVARLTVLPTTLLGVIALGALAGQPWGAVGRRCHRRRVNRAAPAGGVFHQRMGAEPAVAGPAYAGDRPRYAAWRVHTGCAHLPLALAGKIAGLSRAWSALA